MKDSTIILVVMILLSILGAFDIVELHPIEITLLFVGHFIVKAIEDIKKVK